MDLGIIKRFVETTLNKKSASGVGVSVSGGVATVTSVSHGLGIGERFIISNSTIFFFDSGKVKVGSKNVATVPTADTFTFAASGVADGSGTLDYVSLFVAQYFPKAASPPKPYATVKMINRDGRGFSVSEASPQGEPITRMDQALSKFKTAEVEVIFYSSDLSGEFEAQNLAEYFETALGFDRAKEFQHDNDFGVLGIMPARDISLELGDLIERRQVVEFKINYVHELVETDVAYFNQVEPTLEVIE